MFVLFRIKMFNRKGNILLKSINTNKIISNGVADWSKAVLNGFMGSIGNTPLIKLEKLSKESGCNILVKCEYMNPGGLFN